MREGEWVAQLPFFPPMQDGSHLDKAECARVIEALIGEPVPDLQVGYIYIYIHLYIYIYGCVCAPGKGLTRRSHPWNKTDGRRPRYSARSPLPYAGPVRKSARPSTAYIYIYIYIYIYTYIYIYIYICIYIYVYIYT